ncbi:hypothetical protein FOMPIDRAFT_152089 [Fomitopsis schrenkii]|uniref:Uncharacterized protein n=1 Tax=Fomitopsis schrenkii TaxID=2126942 RepID=S8EB34_FOMSC|nr:hypothetical protein FOMPIDRAFT_152089 [Fomitopsis schrenkii]
MKKPRTGDLENTSANEIHTLHPLTRDASGAPQLGEPSSVLSTPQMVTQLTNLEARVGTMQDTMLTISSTLEAMNLMLTRAVHVIAFPGRKKPIRSLQRFLDGMPDETPEHSPPPERSSSPANQYEPTVTHFANTS